MTQIGLRPRTVVLDNLRGRQCAETAAGDEIGVPGEPCQESCCKEVTGASRVHKSLDREGGHGKGLLTGDRHRAMFGTSDHADDVFVTQGRQSGVEISRLVERVQLVLVGEQDVDVPLADQAKELFAIAVDTETVREGERDAATCSTRLRVGDASPDFRCACGAIVRPSSSKARCGRPNPETRCGAPPEAPSAKYRD